MSCILRIVGNDLDPEALAKMGGIKPDSIWKKGEPRFPRNQESPRNTCSGVRYLVSDADFSDLSRQVNDAIRFFQENRDSLKQVAAFRGVEEAIADFGVEIRPPGWASFSFPPTLLSLAGEAGISLMLSAYPVDDEENDEQG